MPFFELSGYGRDTGRQRHRKYKAADAENAIAQASADGTIVEMDTVKRCFPISHFFSKVVGVTHENQDGSDRQAIICQCRHFEGLLLRWDKNNHYSTHAVAVDRQTGEQCGFLPDDTAAEVVEGMNNGVTYYCYATESTGGDYAHGQSTHGLNLVLLVVEDAETPARVVQEYFAAQLQDE